MLRTLKIEQYPQNRLFVPSKLIHHESSLSPSKCVNYILIVSHPQNLAFVPSKRKEMPPNYLYLPPQNINFRSSKQNFIPFIFEVGIKF